jgi:hypothetical protein
MMQRLRLRSMAVALILSALAATSATGEANTGAQIVGALPSTLQGAEVKPSSFKTVTPYDVRPAEYRALNVADRGRIFVWRGYKVSAVFDGRHHLMLVERSCCGLQEWIIFPSSKSLGKAAASADLSSVGVGGITIGSFAAAVRRQFGWSGEIVSNQGTRVLRYRHARSHDCSTFYTFDITGVRVSGISVKNAC